MAHTFFCALGILVVAVMADKDYYRETSQTLTKLFAKRNYDRRIRPFIRKATVNVTVSMTIVNFGQIREKDMDFTVDMFFYQRWRDERLRHSLEYPLYLSGSDKNLVWMPDTFFLNIKTAKTHTVPSDNTKVTIWPSGQIRYSTRLTVTAGCDMNLLDYPLDTQQCNLTILSYSFPHKLVNYIWEDGSTEDIIGIMNDAMSEFDLVGIDFHREKYQYTMGQWVHLTATFKFQRRIEYSLLQVYAPTLLIVALSWLSFWIPKDAAPARIALGITTVLTIVTLMGSLRSEFPKVSYVKAIDLFFIVSFIFVFGSVLEYILLLLKCSLDEEKEKKCKLYQTLDQKETNNGLKYNPNEETNQDSERGRLRQSEVVYEIATKVKTSKNIFRFLFIDNNANVIDRISRVMFPLGYLFFNVAYWLYYKLSKFK